MDPVICLLPGDGIGVDVTASGRRVLEAVGQRFGHQFDLREALIGGAAIDATGSPLPDETAKACESAQAVVLGAVGGPKWSDPNAAVRPEQGLLALRSLLGAFANVRPVRVNPLLADASPLKAELLEGVDIIIVRELTGGIYFGKKTRSDDHASDLCEYTTEEIERVVRFAADLARKRGKQLCSVDKANVLETSRLWRSVTDRVMADDYADIELETLLVDAAAMHLLSRPGDFDVMVTENMFGDILTDEASMLAGSLGMLPSASLGDGGVGLYEPIHGSAPDIAGQGIANPCGMIASIALMLRYSFDMEEEATAVEAAIDTAFRNGARTRDIARDGQPALSTEAMTDAIIAALG